tara:strand:+ start:2294 stop:2719 length:426 start_codon:yes stop_codon:yes gene_type:complete
LIFFSSALELNIIKNIMKNLIIDAAGEKILFKIITEKESYTSNHLNSRENFDEFVALLFNFLDKNKINLKKLDVIFVNQGPGKFSSIRASLAAVKALSITGNLEIYGFNSDQIIDQNYNILLNLLENGELKKNLIKPNYSS